MAHFIFVPSFLQPTDLVSRLEAMCEGSRLMASEAAGEICRRLGTNVSYALYIGSVTSRLLLCCSRLMGVGMGHVP